MKKFSILIGLILIILICIIPGVFKKNRLINNGKFSTGKITEISWGYRGDRVFHYEFKTEKGSLINDQDGRNLPKDPIFIGKFFQVIYNPNDPNENDLLIRRIDFEEYNLVFPDSLLWIEGK